MPSYGSGFAQGMFAGSTVAQRGMDNYEKRQKEEMQGKLFQISQEKQGLDAEGKQYENIMSMVGQASIGDIQKSLADAYIASGEKMDAKVYNAINMFSQGLYDMKEKAADYTERRRLFGQKERMADAQVKNYESMVNDRKQRRMFDRENNDYKRSQDQLKLQKQMREETQAKNDQRTQIQNSYDSAMDGIELIDKMMNHKGREKATGVQAMFPTVAGSDASDFEAMVDTLKSKNFMNQIQNMRGMGALSDAEGKKVSDAITSLNLTQSDKSFKDALSTIRTIYKRGADNASRMEKESGVKIQKRRQDKLKAGTTIRGGDGKMYRVKEDGYSVEPI